MRKWMPLSDLTRPDVWSDISNAIPTPHGTYRNAPGFLGSGTNPATPGTILSAWQSFLVTGAAVNYAGTTTKLYTWSGATFTDRSIGGGYTNTATAWNFAQFGNYTIATNNVDQVQVRDASGAGAFANLGGSPPARAKIPVIQSNVLLLFNITAGGNQWVASDVGNHANFTTGEAVAATPILQRPGDVTAAVAFRDVVIVFKEGSCFQMRYEGSPTYWRVDLLSDAHGAVGQGSVAVCGDVLMVCDYKNGAYLFDGATFRRVDEGMKAYLVQLVLSPNASQYFRNQESVWFNTPTQTVIQYNLQAQAWGKFTARVPDSQVFSGAHVLMIGSGIYDEMRAAVMIDPLATNIPILTAFAEDELAGSNNTALDGYVTSGLFGKPGRMTTVSRVTPALKIPDSVVGTTNIPAATAMSLTPYSQTNPEGTATAGTAVACSTTAEKRFDFTKSAQWQKFKITFTDTPFEIDDVTPTATDGGVSP